MLVNSFVGPAGFLMMMTGHHREAALILAMAALLQIVMNAILIPRYGLIGAATATAATASFTLSTPCWLGKRHSHQCNGDEAYANPQKCFSRQHGNSFQTNR